MTLRKYQKNANLSTIPIRFTHTHRVLSLHLWRWWLRKYSKKSRRVIKFNKLWSCLLYIRDSCGTHVRYPADEGGGMIHHLFFFPPLWCIIYYDDDDEKTHVGWMRTKSNSCPFVPPSKDICNPGCRPVQGRWSKEIHRRMDSDGTDPYQSIFFFI